MKKNIGLFICVMSSVITILCFSSNSIFFRSKLSKTSKLIDLAYKYQDKGNHLKAIEYFSKLIKLDDTDAIAHYNRGWNHTQLNQYNLAIKDFDKVIQLGSYASRAYTNRGAIKYILGEYKDSIYDYDNAIKIDDKDLSVFYNRALSKIQLGEQDISICYDLEKSKSIKYFEVINLINYYCNKPHV